MQAACFAGRAKQKSAKPSCALQLDIRRKNCYTVGGIDTKTAFMRNHDLREVKKYAQFFLLIKEGENQMNRTIDIVLSAAFTLRREKRLCVYFSDKILGKQAFRYYRKGLFCLAAAHFLKKHGGFFRRAFLQF